MPQPKPAKSQSPFDRKFNIVIYGIPESPSGTSRFARGRHDFGEVHLVISSLEQDSNHSSSLRDCRRLGKYAKNESKHRPILAVLNSTADVNNILSRRHLLKTPSISIKPDLTPEERKTNSILLKERWKLISLGTDRRNIKIRGSNIFLNGRLHGKVINSVFSLSPTINDVAPQLSSLADKSLPSVAASSYPSSSAHSNEQINTASTQQQINRNSDWLPSICYWNARSLVNKLSSFQSFVYSSFFDVIAITETWLSDRFQNCELFPSYYSVFRCDRSSRGGGVLLATKSQIPVKLIPLQTPTCFESLTILLMLKTPVIFSVIYVPPHAHDSLLHNLIDHLSLVISQGYKTILVGDFNMPDIRRLGLSLSNLFSLWTFMWVCV